jgi:hypothetical protein
MSCQTPQKKSLNIDSILRGLRGRHMPYTAKNPSYIFLENKSVENRRWNPKLHFWILLNSCRTKACGTRECLQLLTPSQIFKAPLLGLAFQITFSLSLLGVRGRSIALSCSTDAELENDTLCSLRNPVVWLIERVKVLEKRDGKRTKK